MSKTLRETQEEFQAALDAFNEEANKLYRPWFVRALDALAKALFAVTQWKERIFR